MLWILPLTSFSLGIWQCSRLGQKLELIEKTKRKQQLPAVSVESALRGEDGTVAIENELAKDDEYTRVAMFGVFDHSKEMLVGTRPRNDGLDASSRPPGFKNSGYLVVTPFTLLGERPSAGDLPATPAVASSLWEASATSPGALVGKKVLINRGWVPMDAKDVLQNRQQGVFAGPVALEGFLRNGEGSSAWFAPKNEPGQKRWFSVDVSEMARYAGSEPLLVELTQDAPCNTKVQQEDQKGMPLMRVPTAHFRNQHAEYAFTWFALAGVSAFMLWKRRRASLTSKHW
ncbi:surf-like protein [Kappamyces sp. JEL0680]|nr:surf-like protein [Kappamyces sp. JEL0680]